MKKFQIRSVNKTFREDGIPVELVKGEGYFYFIFDRIDANVFETKSEYTMYLMDLTFDSWVDLGRTFAIEMFYKYGLNK